MVTSDYHIPRGCLLYYSRLLLSAYESHDKLLNIVSNAGYTSGHNGYESIVLQAYGITQIAGVGFSTDVPVLSQLKSINVLLSSEIYVGDNLNATVHAVYDNEYTREVTKDAEITGFNKDQVGQQTIHVSYTENDITVESDVVVSVLEKKSVVVDSKDQVETSVKTGDTTDIYGWVSLLIISMLSTFVLKRKYS